MPCGWSTRPTRRLAGVRVADSSAPVGAEWDTSPDLRQQRSGDKMPERFEPQAAAVAEAKIWNNLPVDLRLHAESIETAGQKLKQYLFKCHERI